jgi:2,2-dialkylglycine decarboxylase (pyruvate)
MNGKSLEYWQQYGQYVLNAFPSVDNVIERGEGSFLMDVDGNRLLDLASGQLCATLGTTHPRLTDRVVEQAKRISHTGTQFFSPAVFEAAKKFADVAPEPLKQSIFLSTGSEANECAFRIAKTITGRTGIVGLSRGYYGMTLGTRSITSIFANSLKPDALPTVPDSNTLLSPHCFRCPVNSMLPQCDFLCLDTSLKMLGDRLKNVAAVIVEPFVSAGGMIIPPPGYLRRLQTMAREAGALFIADEAQTAFGRTGKWFGVEHHGIVPDILVISKSAGGGFPASGIIVSEKLGEILLRNRFTHLASHQSDPLAASAISAVIDIVKEEDLVKKAEEQGYYFLERLAELRKKWPIIIDVRGQGLMIGVELGPTPEQPLPGAAGLLMILLCRRRGVHITTTYFEPILRIMPPLVISREQIDFAISVLDASFKDILENNFAEKDLLPVNPYSRRFLQRLIGKKDLRDFFDKAWHEPPKYWADKLRRL